MMVNNIKQPFILKGASACPLWLQLMMDCLPEAKRRNMENSMSHHTVHAEVTIGYPKENIFPVGVSLSIPAGSWNHGLPICMKRSRLTRSTSASEKIWEPLGQANWWFLQYRHPLLYLLYYLFGLLRSSPFHTGLNHVFTIFDSLVPTCWRWWKREKASSWKSVFPSNLAISTPMPNMFPFPIIPSTSFWSAIDIQNNLCHFMQFNQQCITMSCFEPFTVFPIFRLL